jgi:transcriptional regulator with PAS, ATPase and Fis domain
MSIEGTFREDLFYRISVIRSVLPPLRDRPEDIPELANHFVRKFCEQTGRPLDISPKAMQLLENYMWSGNVRELEHTIERAVALERDDEIQPERLPEHITNYNPERISAEFDLPDAGLNLTAHLENLRRHTWSKLCARPPVIRRVLRTCCKCKFARFDTSSINTTFEISLLRCGTASSPKIKT